MIPLFRNPYSSRAASGAIATILAVIAFYTFFTVGGLPTDENIFISTPSFVMIGSGGPEGSADRRPLPDGLHQGDLVIGMGDEIVRTTATLNKVLSSALPESLGIKVFRRGGTENTTVLVSRQSIDAGIFHETPPIVVVTDVLAGGASDRAGMKVGDFIVKINGQTFRTAQEADLILRRGTSGAAIAYEIVRQGEPLQLSVTLARFGFPFLLLAFFLTGLTYMAVGTFLLLKRPTIPAALSIGYWFLLLGFALSVVTMRREPDPTWFTVVRDVLVVLSGFLGTVLAFQSHFLFPVYRMQPWHRRWLLPAFYIVAVFSPLILVLTQSAGLVILLLLVFIVVGFVSTFIDQKPLTVQQKRMVVPVKYTGIGVGVGAFGLIFVLNLIGFGQWVGVVAVTLLLIPLSYLYVIGRYRLLDMDLRVRRNVQYTAISWIWGIVVAVLLLNVFAAVPDLALHVPGITLTGNAVEIGDSPASLEQRVFLERLVMMVAGAVIWLGLWRLRKAGQQVLDRKYDRSRFDYRRAAAELADVLATRLTMGDIAKGITASLVDLLKLKGAGLLVFREDSVSCCEAAVGIENEPWRSFAGSVSRAFTGAVEKHRGPFRVDDLPVDLRTPVAAVHMHSLVPIWSKDRLVGLLLLGEKLSESPHSSEDLAFLAGVSKQVSVAIDNAFLYEDLAEQERMRHELEIARKIQLSSLPSVTPHFPGLEIAGISAPALEVGGDFFDYLNGDGRGLTVVVGDVSGKGTSAALYMSKVQGILRSLHGFDLGPRELFLRANQLLCKDLEKSSFITALGAEFLPERGQAVLVRAGHLPLFLYHGATGTVERVVPRGLGLGLNDAGVFASELEERALAYGPGDILLFLTDGVVEARNRAGDEYGESRLTDLLTTLASRTAVEIRDGILEDLKAFGEDTDQHDDQTVVVVRGV